MKTHIMVVEMFHADGQMKRQTDGRTDGRTNGRMDGSTDRHDMTKLTVAFSYFAKGPKNNLLHTTI